MSLCFQICVFYLVLRGLDTVEDDMAIPNEKKLPMLRVFHTHLTDAKWNVDGMSIFKNNLFVFQHKFN
jgi:phytoene/squalene synthetase